MIEVVAMWVIVVFLFCYSILVTAAWWLKTADCEDLRQENDDLIEIIKRHNAQKNDRL